MSNLPKILKTKTPRMVTRRGSSEVDITQKFIPIILLIALLFPLFSKPIQAFVTPNASYQLQFEQAIQTPEMNLQSFVYETLKATAGSIVTTIFGCVSCPRGEGGGSFGMIGTVNSFIASLYAYPPASGVEYLADIGARLELVHPSYAQEQGLGFARMKPYLPIWKAFRNIAYIFLVLILVFMGFAIMFRVKISPQAVITIQSVLPKVILSLILITFSYAIVGFLIDLMFVAVNLILFTITDAAGIKQYVEQIYPIPITTDLQAFGLIFMAGLIPSFFIMLFFLILPSVIGTIFTVFTGGLGLPVAAAFDLFIVLLLGVVYLFALIRVFWSLLRAYVFVVLNLIFAPFQILIGVLPGSNAIASWFRNLLANLAVFPATLIMVLLSFYLVAYALGSIFELPWQFITGELAFEEFMKQFTSWLTTGTNIAGVTVLSLISLGILLMAPRVSDMIKASLAGQPFAYGAAIGAPIGAAIQVVAAPVRYVTQPITAAAREAWGEEAGYKIPLIRDLLRTGAQRRARTGER